jgi:hypothetical protein
MAAKQGERLAHHLDAGRKVLVDLEGAARMFQGLLRPVEQQGVSRAIGVEERAKRVEFRRAPDCGQRLVCRA